jgi:hypothetical protein
MQLFEGLFYVDVIYVQIFKQQYCLGKTKLI